MKREDFKWHMVTDGELYAVRRRCYLNPWKWVYKSRAGNNWMIQGSVDEFCWVSNKEAMEIFFKIKREKKTRRVDDIEDTEKKQ